MHTIQAAWGATVTTIHGGEKGARSGDGGLQIDSSVPVQRSSDASYWNPLHKTLTASTYKHRRTRAHAHTTFTVHNTHFTHSHTHLYTTVEPLHLPFKLIYWRGFLVFKRDSLSQKELHHWDVRVSAVCLGVGVGGGTLTKEKIIIIIIIIYNKIKDIQIQSAFCLKIQNYMRKHWNKIHWSERIF